MSKDPINRYEEEKRSTIMIGGYGGISIPLDEELKKAISSFIYQKVKDILEDEEEIARQICLAVLRHKMYFAEAFKPIVQQVVEDLDFTVRFEANDKI